MSVLDILSKRQQQFRIMTGGIQSNMFQSRRPVVIRNEPHIHNNVAYMKLTILARCYPSSLRSRRLLVPKPPDGRVLLCCVSCTTANRARLRPQCKEQNCMQRFLYGDGDDDPTDRDDDAKQQQLMLMSITSLYPLRFSSSTESCVLFLVVAYSVVRNLVMGTLHPP